MPSYSLPPELNYCERGLFPCKLSGVCVQACSISNVKTLLEGMTRRQETGSWRFPGYRLPPCKVSSTGKWRRSEREKNCDLPLLALLDVRSNRPWWGVRETRIKIPCPPHLRDFFMHTSAHLVAIGSKREKNNLTTNIKVINGQLQILDVHIIAEEFMLVYLEMQALGLYCYGRSWPVDHLLFRTLSSVERRLILFSIEKYASELEFSDIDKTTGVITIRIDELS